MNRIKKWLENQYKELETNDLDIDIAIIIINKEVVNNKLFNKPITISENISIVKFTTGNITVNIFKNGEIYTFYMFTKVIGLELGDYYWVRYKLNEPEIMQVVLKSNYIYLSFASIGSKDKLEIDDVSIISKIEGL